MRLPTFFSPLLGFAVLLLRLPASHAQTTTTSTSSTSSTSHAPATTDRTDNKLMGYYIAPDSIEPLTVLKDNVWATRNSFAGECAEDEPFDQCSIATTCHEGTLSMDLGGEITCLNVTNCASFTIYQTSPFGGPTAVAHICRFAWVAHTVYRVAPAEPTPTESSSRTSTATTRPPTTPTETSPGGAEGVDDGGGGGGSNSSGAAIGGAVGGAAAVILIAAALFWVFARRRNKKRAAGQWTPNPNGDPSQMGSVAPTSASPHQQEYWNGGGGPKFPIYSNANTPSAMYPTAPPSASHSHPPPSELGTGLEETPVLYVGPGGVPPHDPQPPPAELPGSDVSPGGPSSNARSPATTMTTTTTTHMTPRADSVQSHPTATDTLGSAVSPKVESWGSGPRI